MVLTEYVIAIPSYNRPDTIKKATLKMLSEYNIPSKKYIFLLPINNKKNYMKVKLINLCITKLLLEKLVL